MGAVVELHFELHHFCIKPKKLDSFNATIEQVLILKKGNTLTSTRYKRKNVRDGKVFPFLRIMTCSIVALEELSFFGFMQKWCNSNVAPPQPP